MLQQFHAKGAKEYRKERKEDLSRQSTQSWFGLVHAKTRKGLAQRAARKFKQAECAKVVWIVSRLPVGRQAKGAKV
jgi:hypothetical protein